MRRDVRDRLLLPILLPIGILVAMTAVLFGFSRILLAIEGTPATTTALVVAAAIVAVSAIAASRPLIRMSTIASMVGATAGVAMLAGGIALAVVAGGEGEGPGREPGGPPGDGGGPSITVVAENLAFDTGRIEIPADTPVTITMDNRDAGVQHNIAIYADDSLSEVLFQGELHTGPGTIDYAIPPLPPGEYYFQCDVHPNMNGVVVVTGGGGQPGDGEGGDGGDDGGGPSALTIVAQNIAFDTDTIALPADTATTITMDNRDAGVQHNVAIYTDGSLSEELFNGDLFTGPGAIDYQIPALPSGEYYFLCIVHPNMNGTVRVG